MQKCVKLCNKRVFALIFVNIVPRWHIKGREQALVLGFSIRDNIHQHQCNNPPSAFDFYWLSFSFKLWRCLQDCICAREDSDQPAHPPNLIRVLAFRLKTLWIFCELRRLRKDCADAKADTTLRWVHTQSCRKCCAPSYLYIHLQLFQFSQYLWEFSYSKTSVARTSLGPFKIYSRHG